MRFFFLFIFLSPPAFSDTPDWCTDSPDQWVMPVFFTKVDFAPACRNHDICYLSMGQSKFHCDREFRDHLIRICYEQFHSWAHTIQRSHCLPMAHFYYEGLVMSIHARDRHAYESSQDLACETFAHIRSKVKDVDEARLVLMIAERLAELQARGFSNEDAKQHVISRAELQPLF